MRQTTRIWLMLLPALTVIVALFLGGLLLGLLQSLSYLPFIGQNDFNFDAYIRIFQKKSFINSFLFTLRIAVIATLLSTVLAIILAMVLRHTFAGKRVMTFILQLNLPIPHIVGAVALVLLLSQSGLFARLAAMLGLINEPSQFPVLVFDEWGIGIIAEYVWKETPFIGVILLAVLQTIGFEYEELARSLGANRWQRFRHVLLPLMMPGILSSSVLVFAFSFGSFEIPYLLGIRYPRALPVLAYESYSAADLNERAAAMAMSMVIAVMITVLVYIYMRLSYRYLRTE
ncbi:MAG: sugar ABC transporter permease [Burkholderiaceae bacterium]